MDEACGQPRPSLGITGGQAVSRLWMRCGTYTDNSRGRAAYVYLAAVLSRQIRVIPEPLSLLQVTDPEGKR
ncbi:protein of unknown function [Cupriavidus neocaledonicus]|uniref:Uncharacterized protein n=1 Tax=Cupriavidus neocaledonicus TaxID=1040979 RepID=A0A375HDE0_9BURK|nr:hypothetical protein CBM2605_A280043 [Cupriavidus neocaledonicus]SPD48413.1 protein of unknown function [Cupriavidus neocaledonicus]